MYLFISAWSRVTPDLRPASIIRAKFSSRNSYSLLNSALFASSLGFCARIALFRWYSFVACATAASSSACRASRMRRFSRASRENNPAMCSFIVKKNFILSSILSFKSGFYSLAASVSVYSAPCFAKSGRRWGSKFGHTYLVSIALGHNFRHILQICLRFPSTYL